MTATRDKERIVALQKALRIAKSALERANYGDRGSWIEDAIYEIDKLDWNSKPNLIQERSRV